MSAVKEMSLIPAADAASVMQTFERLAANTDVDVAKLDALIQMQERIMAHNAKAAFQAAFLEMQLDIPEIDEKGAIKDRAGNVQSRYARNEDIQATLRPILQKHGFTLSFRTAWPDTNTVKVIGILTHRDGHARESEFVSAADASGSKNAIQALGSTVSYGHRYTTKDLLNIITRGADDGGVATAKAKDPEGPKGFEDWFSDMEKLAMSDGIVALRTAFKASKVEFRDYATKFCATKWTEIKAKAEKTVRA